MTTPDKPKLTDAATELIKDSIRILKEDGFHFHKTFDQWTKKQAKQDPPKPADGKTEPPKDGDVPPPKPEENEPVEAKRRGVWWGDQKDDE